jgi:UPF0755 protein
MSEKRMSKKGLLLGLFFLVVVVGVVIGWGPIMERITKSVNTKQVAIAISDQLTVQEVAALLKEKKVIDDVDFFLSVAESKGLNNKNIEPGMHAFPAATSYKDLCNALKSGAFEVEVVVTFNNCRTIEDLSEKVAACLMINKEALQAFIISDETCKKYGFNKETIPAMFIPNSYKMYYDTDIEAFVQRMADEFKNFWTADRMTKLKKVGLQSPSEAVTMASIVYGEQSKNAQEWPIIAGLYLNRLNTGMRLQSDPTFKFCWGDELEGVQRLTFEHRERDCPYNTYLHDGLPPGPISMPPAEVVDAVLNRDNNDYIYMCAQPNYDGLHNFTSDYSVHAKNAAEFQKWLAGQ